MNREAAGLELQVQQVGRALALGTGLYLGASGPASGPPTRFRRAVKPT